MTYEFDYQPTAKEIAAGMALSSRSVFGGGWKIVTMLYSIILGVGLATAGFAIGYVVWVQILGRDLADGAGPYYILALALYVLFFLLSKSIRRRHIEAYRACRCMQDQRMTLSEQGVTMDNGRSHSRTSWADVAKIVDRKNVTLLSMGNMGLFVSDRMLAPFGPPQDIRAQLRSWHDAEKGAV